MPAAMWPRHMAAGWGGGSRLLRSHIATVLAGRVGYALCMLSLCGRPGERAPGGAERLPNTLDVSTLHGRPEAGRLARAPEAHHDDATFPPPAPPCLAAREPRVGLGIPCSALGSAFAHQRSGGHCKVFEHSLSTENSFDRVRGMRNPLSPWWSKGTAS